VANTDVFAGMGPDVINGPGFNYGYAGGSFGTGAGFFNVRPTTGATGVNPSLRFMTVDQQRMIITNAGNVGIGTSAPTQMLDVVGDVSATGGFDIGGTRVLSSSGVSGNYNTALGYYANNSMGVGNSTAIGAYAQATQSNSLVLGSINGVNSATADTKVGIGTTAPTSKLHVANGNALIGGNVTLSGNLALPATTATAGVITLGGSPFAHNFGAFNTFLGANAGNLTMTGSSNAGSGFYALYNNTGGNYSTASGSYALYSNTTGNSNTANGYFALRFNTTGFSNTASGSLALYHNTSGNGNIAIGDSAGGNLTTGDNNIDIGNQGVAAEANTIRIGTGGTQTKAFIAGISGVTTGGAAVAVVVDANGQLGTVSSSRRYKADIAGMGDATEGLMRLRPVRFRYLAHGDNAPVQYGLIAEEVAEVYPELVARNKDGEVETVMYQFLPPMLLNEVQKQQTTIAALNRTLDQRTADLQAENAALRDQFDAEKAVLRDQLQRLMQRVEQLEVKRSARQ
jgi:hypothetical protein